MTELFIGGTWRAAATGKSLAAIEPSTGKAFDNMAAAGPEDIDLAVGAARAAYDGAWGRMSATERGRLMSKLALRILEEADDLAALEARDTGKPMRQARADIAAVARYFEFYGAGADKLHGETIPYLAGYNVAVVKEPYGVTGHIIPWNYPAQMFGRTLAPALAVGNATVLKPAEDACLTTVRLIALMTEVGFPEGAVNLVTGLGAEAGAALAAHPGVDFISFTGSPEVGILVQKAAADHYAPCVLELGGKSPQIVFDDADTEAALPLIVGAIVQNGGQTCSAGSRVLVQRGIYDSFVADLASRFSALRVGSHEMDLDCGPLISAKQKARVAGFVDQARSDAIPIIAEGSIDPACPADGFYQAPILFGPVPQSNDLAREEVFGPVLSVLPFADEEDAVSIANATDYGLVAAVWTRDGGRQQRMPRRLRCGQVFVNCYGAGGGVELPFGGIGKSGHGREKGFMAMDEFCISKTVVNHYGASS